MLSLEPPEALPVCLDACFDQGTGWQAIPAAMAFRGEDLHFSATGGGADIDADTGVLYVPTGRPHDGAVIRVQAENEAGTAATELHVTVEDDGTRAETALTERLEIDGFIFLFERPVQTGHFISGANGFGDPFVIGPIRLIHYAPGPARLDTGRHVNGAMLNPPCTQDTGFDSLADRDTYSPDLNAGLRLPLDLEPGDRLVVCRSNPRAQRATEAAERFAVLTCLAEAPFEDSFRPPYSGSETPLWRLSDIRADRLPQLPAVGALTGGAGSRALAARFARFSLDIIPHWNRAHLNTPLHAPLYGRDLCTDEAEPLLFLASNRPLEDKVDILIGLVQRGIDRYGVFRSAIGQGFHPWRADGGHNSGRKASILFAGSLLGDQDMLSVMEQGAAMEGGFQEDEMTFYVTEEFVAVTNSPEWSPPYGSDDAIPKQPYSPGMIGMPEWRGRDEIASTNAAWTGHPYRIAGNHNTQHAQVLIMLAMGLRGAWGHDAYFDYHMRYCDIMSGRPDPWRFRGGSQALYDPVVGSRPAGGWSGWQIHWEVPRAWRMLEAYRDRFYSFPWA